MTITDAVFNDPEITGGCPPVPENATSFGVVDPANFPLGTVITVTTKSMSKWIITILQNGRVDIQHNIWYFGRYFTFSEFEKGFTEAEQFFDEFGRRYPMFGISIRTPNHQSLPHPDQKNVNLQPFKEGDRLTWMGIGFSGPIVFWSINE